MYRNITVSLLKSYLSKLVIHVKECLTGVNTKQNEHEVQIEIQYKQQHLMKNTVCCKNREENEIKVI